MKNKPIEYEYFKKQLNNRLRFIGKFDEIRICNEKYSVCFKNVKEKSTMKSYRNHVFILATKQQVEYLEKIGKGKIFEFTAVVSKYKNRLEKRHYFIRESFGLIKLEKLKEYQKEKIIFDVDGVLFNGIEEVCKLNEIPYENITEYNYDLMDITDEQKEIIKSSFLSNYKNYPNFDEELFEKICEKYDVSIHSLYSTDIEKESKLDYFSNFNISNIELTHIENKKIIEKTDYFVEDKVSNLLRNEDSFKKGILINQPYNVNYTVSKNIKRFDNVNMFFKYLLHLAN